MQQFLRVLVGMLGLAALALAVGVAIGVVQVLDPDYNQRAEPDDLVIADQPVVGFGAVLALLVGGGAGLAFASTGAHRWFRPAAIGTLCALPLLVGWGFLALLAGSS